MVTDAELIRLYARGGDESAFAEIARRHGPMVYRVCLRLLGDAHEAEDASQAAFCVLVRRARSLSARGDLSSWLHGVARRVSLEALRARRRRGRHEEEAAVRARDENRLQEAPALEGAARSEALAGLDEELAALPARTRRAVILRYLEGHSQREAAEIAGVPQGTLARRAAEGLDRLRGRLSRRGAALSGLAAGSLAGLLASEASAAVPASLLPSVMAASSVAAGAAAAAAGTGAVSPLAASLAEGVIEMMFWAKVKVAAAVVVAVTVTGLATPMAVRALAQEGNAPGGQIRQGDNPQVAPPRADANVRRAADPNGGPANPAGPDSMSPGRRLLAFAMKDPVFKRLYEAHPGVEFAEVKSVTSLANDAGIKKTVRYEAAELLKGKGATQKGTSVTFDLTAYIKVPQLHSRDTVRLKVPAYGWDKAFIFRDADGNVKAVYQYDAPADAPRQNAPGADPAGGANANGVWQGNPGNGRR